MITRFHGLPIDNTGDTHAKFIGLLAERLATKRLDLLKCVDPEQHKRLRAEVRDVLAALKRARGEPDAGRAVAKMIGGRT